MQGTFVRYINMSNYFAEYFVISIYIFSKYFQNFWFRENPININMLYNIYKFIFCLLYQKHVQDTFVRYIYICIYIKTSSYFAEYLVI